LIGEGIDKTVLHVLFEVDTKCVEKLKYSKRLISYY